MPNDQYVFKNLKNLVTKETLIFIIVIACRLISIFLSLFSYGVFRNYKAETNQINIGNEVIDESDRPVFNYALDVSEENPIDCKTVREFAEEAGNLLKDKIYNLYMECEDNVTISLSYENGMYKPTEEWYINTLQRGHWMWGEWFTDEQIANNEKVCVIGEELIEENYELRDKDFDYEKKPLAKKKGDDYYINIGGEEFRVIGMILSPDLVCTSLYSLPDDFAIETTPELEFYKNLTQKEYDSLVAIYEKYFSDRIISTPPELEIYDPEQVYYYKTNMAISLFIAIVSAINFALLFNYIFDKRRRTMAVFRLTGCTANKVRRMYLTEIMLIMIPLIIICTILFNKYILPQLDGLFPYISQVYKTKVYLIMAGIYIGVSYIIMNIMIILHLRKTPVLILNKN